MPSLLKSSPSDYIPGNPEAVPEGQRKEEDRPYSQVKGQENGTMNALSEPPTRGGSFQPEELCPLNVWAGTLEVPARRADWKRGKPSKCVI